MRSGHGHRFSTQCACTHPLPASAISDVSDIIWRVTSLREAPLENSRVGVSLSIRSRLWLYLLWAIAGLLLSAIAVLAMGRTDWFVARCGYPALIALGYGEKLRAADCEILIYGDSSAMTGLDPRVIERRTGLKSCNIAEGTTVQDVIGTETPLDDYLAHNKPPRVLLTTWTPTIFTPYAPPMRKYSIEGMWYAFRFGDFKQLFSPKFFEWTLDFMTWEYRSMRKGLPAKPLTARAERAEHLGQISFDRPPETRCTKGYSDDLVHREDASVELFRRKYSSQHTKVLVDITPVPDCDPLFALYLQRKVGLYDNTLERYRIYDFNDSDVHLSPAGTELYSEQAATQVKAVLAAR